MGLTYSQAIERAAYHAQVASDLAQRNSHPSAALHATVTQALCMLADHLCLQDVEGQAIRRAIERWGDGHDPAVEA